MRALFLFTLMLMGSVFSTCIDCDELAGAPKANILLTMDENNTELGIIAYYENLSVSPSRQPIDDYIILVHISNTTGLDEVFRVYTNDNGTATFNFGAWSDGCINFQAIYCPFCDPTSKQCGFEACLNYSNIDVVATSVEDIPLAPGESALGTLNPNKYLPAKKTTSYCPPPAPLSNTPAVCLPLLIIFAILSGSMYLTGRNPFAGFNLGGARVGRHIRYQARGRGFSFSLMALASAGLSIGQAAKTASKGKGALAKSEKQAASQRFIGAGIGKAARGVKSFKGALTATRHLSGSARAKAMSKHMDAFSNVRGTGAGSAEQEGASGTMTGSGMNFLPGGGGGVRLSEIVSGDRGLMSNLGSIFGVVFAQTTVGRIVDGYTYMASDEGLLSHMGIVNHERRMEDDMSAMRNILADEEDGGGIRVTVGDRTYVVRGMRTDDSGNTTLALYMPSGEAATSGAEATRGQRIGDEVQITMNSEGVITSMSYQAQMGIPEGGGPPQQAFVTVRQDADNPGNLIAEINTGVPGAEPQILSRADVDAAAWDRVAAPTMQTGTGVMIGQDASQLLNDFNTQRDSARQILASANMELGRSMTNISGELSDAAERTPGDRQRIAQERREMALEALTGLGLNPETISVSGPVSETEREGSQTHFFGNLKSETDDFGTVSRMEVAAREVNEIHDDSVFSGAQVSEDGTTRRQEFIGGVVSAAGLDPDAGGSSPTPAERQERGDARTLTSLMPSIIGNATPRELSRMSAGEFQEHVTQAFIARGEAPETAASRAASLCERVDPEAIRQIQSAGTSFVEDLSQRFNPAFAQTLAQSDMSQIDQVAQAGRFMDDSPDTVTHLVARDPTAYSQDVRGQAMEYRAMQQMSQSINGMSSQIDGNSFRMANLQMDQFVEMNNVFLQTRYTNVQIASGDVTSGIGEAISASEDLYQATYAGARMDSAGMVDTRTIDAHISQERAAREQLSAAIQGGDREAAQAIARRSEQYYTNIGDYQAAAAYSLVGDFLHGRYEAGMTTVTRTFDMLASPESVGRSAARASAEIQREEGARAQITGHAERRDFSTAIAAASDRYEYHRDMGNEEMAGRYLQTISTLSSLRERDFSARQEGRAGLEASAYQQGAEQVSSILRPEDRTGFDREGAPHPADVAQGYLRQRFERLSRGSQTLIDLNEGRRARGEEGGSRPPKRYQDPADVTRAEKRRERRQRESDGA